MYRMIAVFVFITIGCAPEPNERNGQGTTIVDADAVVLGLSHEDVSITVYKYNWWLIGSSSDCKTLRGDITDAQIAELNGYMADDAVQKLGRECSGDNYRLTMGSRPSVCFGADQKSPGIGGLLNFYEDKVTKLAAAPAGNCGANQTVEPSNWPTKDRAAGSGG